MTTAIKAILFDKDGTLLDFDATFAPAYAAAAEFAATGSGTPGEDLLRGTGMDLLTRKAAGGSLLAAGNSAEIAQAWIALGAAHPVDVLTRELDRIFTSAMRTAVALPAIPETLGRLHRMGFHLGVASSDSEAAIRTFLDAKALSPHIRFVAGYDSGHGPKPEPGMMLAFANALGLEPSAIAVVGDNTHDLEMARAAGAGLAIGVLSGTSRKTDLAPLADDVLESAADLVRYFG